MKHYRVLGIGGFMGSGKTTAGKFLCGAEDATGAGAVEFIDCDALVDDLYQPGKDGYLKVENYFGADFVRPDGVDRRKLGDFVFGDVNKLKILEYMMHPLVANEVQKRLDKVAADFVVLEATYFEEQYVGRFVDALLWIECGREVLWERVKGRDGMSEKRFQNIVKVQESAKPGKINFVVQNEGTLENFYVELDRVWADFVRGHER